MGTSNLGHGLFVQRGGKSSDDASGISPLEARKSMAGLFEVTGSNLVPREGVLIGGSSSLLAGSSAGMQVFVRPFTLALARQKNGADGIIFMSNISDSTIDIDPAPTAGTRVDVIYVAHNESTSDTTNSTPYFGVAKGTVGTPGTKPTVPQFAYELGSFTVGTNAANLANVSITETWQYTGLRGTPIPVRNQAERDALTKRAGLQVMRLDRNNELDTCDGTYWRGNTGWQDMSFANSDWQQVAGGQPLQWRFVADGTMVMVRGEFKFTGSGGKVYEGWSHATLPPEARPRVWTKIQGLGDTYNGSQIWTIGTDGKITLGANPKGVTFIYNDIFPVK